MNSIWLHNELSCISKKIYQDFKIEYATSTATKTPKQKLCKYCSTDMYFIEDWDKGIDKEYFCFICPACGWWTIQKAQWSHNVLRECSVTFGAGALAKLAIADQNVPICELRQYVLAKYNTRYEINPKKFEELVASIYSNLGYEVEIIGRPFDNGLDILLVKDGLIYGVQVKRYKNNVDASIIREVSGSLNMKTYSKVSKAIVVTTSKFTEHAIFTADEIDIHKIELVDCDHLLELLRLSNINYNMQSNKMHEYIDKIHTFKLPEVANLAFNHFYDLDLLDYWKACDDKDK